MTCVWRVHFWNYYHIPQRSVSWLTHWGGVTLMCISKLSIIGSDHSLLPGRRHAMIWTKAGIMLIGPLGKNSVKPWSKFIHFHSQKWIWKCCLRKGGYLHYNDVRSKMGSRITSLAIVYSTVYSGADQRKHQSSGSLAFVWGSHRWPVNSPHKWPVTQKMFPFDDVIMCLGLNVLKLQPYPLGIVWDIS